MTIYHDGGIIFVMDGVDDENSDTNWLESINIKKPYEDLMTRKVTLTSDFDGNPNGGC